MPNATTGVYVGRCGSAGGGRGGHPAMVRRSNLKRWVQGVGLPLSRCVNLGPGPRFFNSQHTHLPNSENNRNSPEGCCKSERGRMNGNCETCYTMAGKFPPKPCTWNTAQFLWNKRVDKTELQTCEGDVNFVYRGQKAHTGCPKVGIVKNSKSRFRTVFRFPDFS